MFKELEAGEKAEALWHISGHVLQILNHYRLASVGLRMWFSKY